MKKTKRILMEEDEPSQKDIEKTAKKVKGMKSGKPVRVRKAWTDPKRNYAQEALKTGATKAKARIAASHAKPDRPKPSTERVYTSTEITKAKRDATKKRVGRGESSRRISNKEATILIRAREMTEYQRIGAVLAEAMGHRVDEIAPVLAGLGAGALAAGRVAAMGLKTAGTAVARGGAALGRGVVQGTKAATTKAGQLGKAGATKAGEIGTAGAKKAGTMIKDKAVDMATEKAIDKAKEKLAVESSGGTANQTRKAKYRTPENQKARSQFNGPRALSPWKSDDLPAKFRVSPGADGVGGYRDQVRGSQDGDTDDAKSDRRITDRGRPADARTGPVKPGSLSGDRIDPRERTNKYNAGRGWGVPGKAGRKPKPTLEGDLKGSETMNKFVKKLMEWKAGPIASRIAKDSPAGAEGRMSKTKRKKISRDSVVDSDARQTQKNVDRKLRTKTNLRVKDAVQGALNRRRGKTVIPKETKKDAKADADRDKYRRMAPGDK